MPILPAPYYAAALLIRAAAFFAVLGLLPGRWIPLSARLALCLSFVVFFFPFLPGADSLLIPGLLAPVPAAGRAPAPWPGLAACLVAEICCGTLLGIAAGTAGYAAQLFAGWLSGAAFASDGRKDASPITRPLQSAALLLFLYLLVSSPALPALWMFFGRSLFRFPPAFASAALEPGTGFLALIQQTASLALGTAFVAALPVFTAVLVVDIACLPWRRLMPQSFDPCLAAALRAPAAITVLAFFLYFFSGTLDSVLQASLTPRRAGAVIEAASSAAKQENSR